MWFMQREDMKDDLRDLEAVHNILMSLTSIKVIRRDKELSELIGNSQRKVLSKTVQLRDKVYAPSRFKLW